MGEVYRARDTKLKLEVAIKILPDEFSSDPERVARFQRERPWRDGTTHVVYEPLELLEKLSALVPVPRAHVVRYAGVLAPASKWRSMIVPAAGESAADTEDVTDVSVWLPDPMIVRGLSRCASVGVCAAPSELFVGRMDEAGLSRRRVPAARVSQPASDGSRPYFSPPSPVRRNIRRK